MWNPPDLSGRIALVAGATKGVGRGIAEVLGECGATVYVTGRTSRETLPEGWPDWTVEAVAEAIEASGGTGIPVRCDHRDDDSVERLFERIRDEQGGLDILVNNLVGWADDADGPRSPGASAGDYPGRPIWEQPLHWWDSNMGAGLRAHVAACRFGIPLMLGGPGGIVIFTSERSVGAPAEVWDAVLDLRAVATARLVELLAHQLHPQGIAAVLLYPGWTRTEDIVALFESGSYTGVKSMEELVEKTVSPQFSGRAAAALAADGEVLGKAGRLLVASDLAREYGFSDIDGRIPDPP